MPKQTHCKFKCTELASYDPEQFLRIKLEASYDQGDIDDQSFSRATPSGVFDATIANPAVFPVFALGKNYRVVIEEIEEIEP